MVNLELKPRQKINFDQLAKECQTSKIPVRGAFNKFTEKKLVKVNPRESYFVVNLPKEQVTKLYGLQKTSRGRK